MTVSELMNLLEDCDPDAEVLILNQPSYPFENSIMGVTVRSEISGEDDEDEDDEAPSSREDGTRPNDVFILEGQQLRYGSRDAWAAAGR